MGSTGLEQGETRFPARIKLSKWGLTAAMALPIAPRPARARAIVDGVRSEVADWPLIVVHVAIGPDKCVLTYGID